MSDFICGPGLVGRDENLTSGKCELAGGLGCSRIDDRDWDWLHCVKWDGSLTRYHERIVSRRELTVSEKKQEAKKKQKEKQVAAKKRSSRRQSPIGKAHER